MGITAILVAICMSFLINHAIALNMPQRPPQVKRPNWFEGTIKFLGESFSEVFSPVKTDMDVISHPTMYKPKTMNQLKRKKGWERDDIVASYLSHYQFKPESKVNPSGKD